MIKIAHRGNVHGPSNMENHPDHIMSAISLGYDVEIDIWSIDGVLYLGHDKPQYEIDDSFIFNVAHYSWFHCKNIEALDRFVKLQHFLRFFWHQEDDFTLTSNCYIWTYPGKTCTERSILVHLDIPNDNILLSNIYGICSDYVGEF